MEEDMMNASEFMLQIMSSIRKVDGTMGQVRDFILNEMYRDECKDALLKKYERLKETRMMLTYSIMDMKQKFESTLFDDSEFDNIYGSLKG
jgi:DNA-binding cell septation regulator SpoVG